MSKPTKPFSALALLSLSASFAPTLFAAQLNASDVAGLVDAVRQANDEATHPGPDTIVLNAGTYTFSTPDNWEYGPNALPPITSDITIQGNGAVLDSNEPVRLRFFYVSGGLSYDSATNEGLPAGKLTLHDLTLKNGRQQGGHSYYGGAGMGAGGAIFNQGELTLERVTLNNNSATGGTAGLGGGGGGAGMGQDAQFDRGGGFGGLPLGKGGSGSSSGGGGGGGFRPADNGLGNTGGGQGQLGSGGIGDGGNGGFRGGSFGGGGGRDADWGGGGGGVGGGGGFGGSGGFGGGGGQGNSGGFGGGSGSAGGGFGRNGGFGGGTSYAFANPGGGGGGFGGALFNHRGILNLINTTLTANTAHGGNSSGNFPSGSGSGFGGAVFNLNGTVSVVNSTLAANTVIAGTGNPNGSADGGAIYTLAYGNKIEDGTASTASVTLRNSILAASTDGNSNSVSDLVNDKRDGSNPNTATADYGGQNIVMVSSALNGTGFTGTPSIADPQLGTLQNNGGLTDTLLPQAGSPAINAGNDCVLDNSCGVILSTDQRGAGFARKLGTHVDIGAVEMVPPNTAPGIDGKGVSIPADSTASKTIATVSDKEDALPTLSVTPTSASSAGVSYSGLNVDSNGNVTASVSATCTANTTTFPLTVTDSGDLSASTNFSVTVTPETGLPTLTLKPNLTWWSPNHKYTGVSMSQLVNQTTDNCTTPPLLKIVKVTSDEADDAPGNADGTTTKDIVIDSNCQSVHLRSERSDALNGRVYLVTVQAQDAVGNKTLKDFKVSVPRSQNTGAAVQGAAVLTKSCTLP